MAYEKITLENICHGGLEERFQIELNKVLENIKDPNTDIKKIREVTIKISLVSDESQENVKYALDVRSKKLAPIKSIGGNLAMAAVGEKTGLYQEKSRGLPLFEEKKTNEIRMEAKK